MNKNNEQNRETRPDLTDRMIKIQEQDLMLRSQELDIRKQHQQNSLEFANNSLRANVTDQENERKYQIQSKKLTYKYSVIFVFIFLFFILGALYLNKDEIIKEIIRAIIYISTAGTSGYYLGKNKKMIEIQNENR